MSNKKEKNNKLNKVKKILLCLCGLLIITLIMFLIINNTNNDSKNLKQENKKEEKINTHISYDNLFSINTNESWKQIENKNSLNENAVIEIYNKEKNAYLVVVVNKKEDLNEDFNAYKTKVFKQKESFYKTEIQAYHDVKIDNYNCQYGEIYYTNSDNINTYIRSYAIETKNYYGQIVVWTIKSNQNELKKEFDKVVESFKEI